MKLFESERKVMEVLWREGSVTAGDIARILSLDTGWNRNTTYTVINKCINKGYILRGKTKFMCTALITKEDAQSDELDRVAEEYFDGSRVKLFALLARKSDKQEIKRMKKIIKNA